jgi:hypothetical protein
MTVAKSEVHKLLDGLQAIFEAVGVGPASGSPADVECKSFARPESVRTAFSQGCVALEGAADHLAALDDLVRQGRYALVPWTCARGCLESAAIADWLLDRRIDAQARIKRSLAHRFSNLDAQRKLANADSKAGDVKKVEARLDEVEKIATGLGFALLRDRNGKRTGIGEIKPKMTDLLEKCFDFGGVYRVLSGIAHAETSAVSQLGYTDTGARTSHGIVKRPEAQAKLLEGLVTNVAAVYGRVTWLRVEQYGCDRVKAIKLLDSSFDRLGLTKDKKFRVWR